MNFQDSDLDYRMARRLLLTLTLLATFCSSEAKRVVISETNFDRAQFLEFYNPGEIEVDLTGYTIIDGFKHSSLARSR